MLYFFQGNSPEMPSSLMVKDICIVINIFVRGCERGVSAITV